MKLLLDFFPALAFLISYKIFDIYVATGVLIVSSFIQTVGHYWLKKQFEKLHVITFVVAVVMGSLTLFFHDDSFIKWKVSVIYWILSATIFIFLLRKRIAMKDMLQGLMKQELGLPDRVWHMINLTWAIALFAIGFLNLWVAYQFSLDTWVNFKVWGTMAIQMLMLIVTFIVIFKYMPEENRKALEDKPNDEQP
jgi:intracellular septation protein